MIEVIGIIWLIYSISAAAVMAFLIQKLGYDYVKSYTMEDIDSFSFEAGVSLLVAFAPVAVIGFLAYKLVNK